MVENSQNTRRRIFPRFTIGVRLISFVVLVALLAGGAVGFAVINTSRESLRQEILNANLVQADLTAEFASNYITARQTNIRQFASNPTLRQAILNDTSEQTQTLLSQFAQVQAGLTGASIFDANGIQRVFSTPGAPAVGQSFMYRNYVQQTLATGQPYLDVPTLSVATGKATAPYGVAVVDGQGKPQGVVSGGISLAALSDALTKTGFDNVTHVSIIDTRNGGLIVADTHPEHLLTQVTKDEAISRLLAGERGAIEITSSTGELNLIGFAPVPDLPWGVMVTTPSKSALAIIDTLTITAGFFTGFAILLAAVTGGILMLGVTRPVRRLADATREIGSGNLDYSVDVSGHDEIGDLSRAFGHMAQELKKTLVSRDELAKEVSERKLAEEENALKARLLDAATDSIVLRDFDGEKQTAVVYANEAAYQSRGYTREEFLKLDINDYITPESAIDYNARFRQIVEKGAGIFEVVHRRKDGSTMLVEVHSNPIFVNNRSYILSVMHDVTARKKAEDTLKASEEMYRGLFENSQVGMYRSRLDGSAILDANKKLCEIFGYSREEMVTNPATIRWANPLARQEMVKQIRDTGLLTDYEVDIVTKNGAIKNCLVSVRLFPKEGYIEGSAIDITERIQAEKKLAQYREHLEELVKERTSELEKANNGLKQEIDEHKKDEEALKSSEEKYRNLVDNIPVGVSVSTTDGEAVERNKAFMTMFGFESKEEALRTPSQATYFDPNDRLQMLELLKKGKVSNFEVQRRRRDGTTLWVSMTAIPAPGDLENQLITVTQDISERKKAEEALAHAASIPQLNPNPVVEISRNGEINFTNIRAEALFPDLKEMKLLHPFLSGWEKYIEELANDENKPVVREINVGGRYYLQSIRYSSTIKGLLFYGADITDRKKAETALARQTEIASHQARELEMANVELSAVNKELEAFSYSVSHDLRAPLRSIDGFSQILLEEYGERFEGEGKDYLKRVRQASQRMGVLIDDVLGLSRVTRSEMHIIPIDLSALANLIVDELRSAQPDRRVEVVIEPGLKAEGDANLVRIMLTNFLSNAWKFTGKHTQAKIEFGKTIRDGKEVFFVRDDGAGFDMAYAGKLFQPFQRLHGLSEFEGTGIGLATTQRVINRHGGKVWVEAAVEKGATFYFTI